MSSKKHAVSTKLLKTVFYVACGIFLLLLVIHERHTFLDSLHLISHISVWWIVAGFGALLLSVIASGTVYVLLSPKPLKFWPTVLVQAGGLGINRLLPAGSGALGVSFLYLRANKVSSAIAASVVAVNNLLGFVGHALLLGIAIGFYPGVIHQFSGLNSGKFWLLLGLATGAILGIVVLIVVARKSKQKIFRVVQPVLSRPGQLSWALVFSMLITLCYMAAILLAAAALGYHLSFAAAMIVLSFGVAAASAVPVPGGIGAAEAGIFAGMHAYGASIQDALAIALLYRLMTFWLPLVFGGVAFIIVLKRQYLSR